jgi:hypothetical protein
VVVVVAVAMETLPLIVQPETRRLPTKFHRFVV